MWINPIHVVARQYGFSQQMYDSAMAFFQEAQFNFDISPFEDFGEMTQLTLPMV